VFAGAWTSDLVRSSRFAMLAHGGAHPDSRLRELDFGRIDGLTWEECDRVTREGLTRFEGFAAPGGETVDELRGRVTDFLADLSPGRHLVFTHGGVIRLLTREAGAPVLPEPGEVTVLALPSRVPVEPQPEDIAQRDSPT
jgi:probable phosphoglycerate mutase